MCQLNVIENELSQHGQICLSQFRRDSTRSATGCIIPKQTCLTPGTVFILADTLSQSLEDVNLYAFPSVPYGQSGLQNHEPQLQGNLDSPELAQNAFVL